LNFPEVIWLLIALTYEDERTELIYDIPSGEQNSLFWVKPARRTGLETASPRRQGFLILILK